MAKRLGVKGLRGGGARETDQVQPSLAHCVGQYLGPLQLSPLSRLFNLLLAVFSQPSGLLQIICQWVYI